jgi:hypothetical protein
MKIMFSESGEDGQKSMALVYWSHFCFGGISIFNSSYTKRAMNMEIIQSELGEDGQNATAFMCEMSYI